MSKKSDKKKSSTKEDGKKKQDAPAKKTGANTHKEPQKEPHNQPQKKAQDEVVDDGRLKRKEYEGELKKLQTELCHLQEWVKETGERIVIIFEGRDAAGKGGTIKAITERVSPRVFRLVALPAPSDREKSQLYVQRFVPHLPAAGEIVIFDRSWYNRAGVEHVMGFCNNEQYKKFLELCPMFEKTMTDNGIRLFKFWLEVSNEEQERRFEARIEDPLRQWKLSNMDLPSREKWYQYSKARDIMMECTDTDHAPWYLVDSNDKKRARLNLISHLLSKIPYKKIERKKVKLPDRSEKDKYDDTKKIKNRKWVAQKYK